MRSWHTLRWSWLALLAVAGCRLAFLDRLSAERELEALDVAWASIRGVMSELRRSAPLHTDELTDENASEPPIKPLSMKGGFGTALGAAMLGFEQALRNEPPAEILAAEHMPEPGRSGDQGDLVIEFPEPLDDKDRQRR